MIRRLSIFLPLPPEALWPNSRPHYLRKSDKTRQYRGACHLRALAAAREIQWGQPARAASLQLTFLLAGRKRDPDNCVAAMKAAIDGLADAQVITNDRDLTILPPRVRPITDWRKDPAYRRGPGVLLEVIAEY